MLWLPQVQFGCVDPGPDRKKRCLGSDGGVGVLPNCGGGGIQVDLEGHPRIPTWGSTFPSGTSAGDPIVTRVQNLSPSSLVGTALPGRAEGEGLLEGQVAGNDPVGAAGTTVCAWKQI